MDTENANELIRKSLKAARTERGFTEMELARRLNIPIDSILLSEHLPINVPLDQLYRIIAYLDLRRELEFITVLWTKRSTA